MSVYHPRPTRRAHTEAECITSDPEGIRLWCRSCAAAYLGITAKTLSNWRNVARGPRVLGAAGTPRYRKADLDAWAGAEAA